MFRSMRAAADPVNSSEDAPIDDRRGDTRRRARLTDAAVAP
jgi:hypothetical protein